MRPAGLDEPSVQLGTITTEFSAPINAPSHAAYAPLEAVSSGNDAPTHVVPDHSFKAAAKVNASFEESGDNDDAQELDFSEFQEVVARICHFKIPASQREGSAFELTLHTWLTLLFLPKYKALLKEKKRGTGKKHL